MTKHLRTSTSATAFLMALFASSACSNEGEAAGNGIPADTSEVSIGFFPLAHTATAVHGDEAGIFAEHNLDVDLVETEGGAEAIAALVSGQYDITYSNYTSAVLAQAQGLPITIVAANDVGAGDHGVYVTEDSDIDSLDDLAGSTVTVNNLQNIGTIAYYAHLEAAGHAPEDIDLVEMPNPDMRAALDSGDVDAIWQVEPFQTMAEHDGFVRVDNLFSGEMEDVPVAGWVTTEQFAQEHPEIITAYQEAMGQATEELNADENTVQSLVPTFTLLDEELVEEMVLPRFQSDLDLEWLQQMVDMMDEYGLIDETFDVTEMIADD